MSLCVEIRPYDPGWPSRYVVEETRIRRALRQQVRYVAHVGSTSVAGLSAKPIIDIVLAVQDSSDEPSYAPLLEQLGYELRIREPDWHEHRVFRGEDDDVNLHVFTDGAEEIERMVRFRDRLRSDQVDRALYENLKLELAEKSWASIQDYANAKSEVVEDILTRS